MGALPQLMIMLYAAATDLTFSEMCHDSVFLFRLAACVRLTFNQADTVVAATSHKKQCSLQT